MTARVKKLFGINAKYEGPRGKKMPANRWIVIARDPDHAFHLCATQMGPRLADYTDIDAFPIGAEVVGVA